MNNKRFDRQGKTDFSSRRANAQGTPVPPTSVDQQTYGDKEIAIEVARLLTGTLGTYHLFGCALRVQPAQRFDGVEIKFLGGLPDCQLVQAGVRNGHNGHYIMLNQLFGYCLRGAKEGTSEDTLLVLAFLDKHLGNEARAMAQADREARQAAQQGARESLLSGVKMMQAQAPAVSDNVVRLHKKPGPMKPAKPEVVTLQTLEEVMTTERGIFTTDDGIVLRVGPGPQFGTVIRVITCPDDHPETETLAECKKWNIFVGRHDLGGAWTLAEDAPRNVELRVKLALWLRDHFARHNIVIPESQADTEHVVDQPAASAVA